MSPQQRAEIIRRINTSVGTFEALISDGLPDVPTKVMVHIGKNNLAANLAPGLVQALCRLRGGRLAAKALSGGVYLWTIPSGLVYPRASFTSFNAFVSIKALLPTLARELIEAFDPVSVRDSTVAGTEGIVEDLEHVKQLMQVSVHPLFRRMKPEDLLAEIGFRKATYRDYDNLQLRTDLFGVVMERPERSIWFYRPLPVSNRALASALARQQIPAYFEQDLTPGIKVHLQGVRSIPGLSLYLCDQIRVEMPDGTVLGMNVMVVDPDGTRLDGTPVRYFVDGQRAGDNLAGFFVTGTAEDGHHFLKTGDEFVNYQAWLDARDRVVPTEDYGDGPVLSRAFRKDIIEKYVMTLLPESVAVELAGRQAEGMEMWLTELQQQVVVIENMIEGIASAHHDKAKHLHSLMALCAHIRTTTFGSEPFRN